MKCVRLFSINCFLRLTDFSFFPPQAIGFWLLFNWSTKKYSQGQSPHFLKKDFIINGLDINQIFRLICNSAPKHERRHPGNPSLNAAQEPQCYKRNRFYSNMKNLLIVNSSGPGSCSPLTNKISIKSNKLSILDREAVSSLQQPLHVMCRPLVFSELLSPYLEAHSSIPSELPICQEPHPSNPSGRPPNGHCVSWTAASSGKRASSASE